MIDAELVEQARCGAPSTVERLGRRIVHRLDPERADRFDPQACEQRTCSMSMDFSGTGMLRLITDPLALLELRAIVARFSAPRPAGTAVGEDGSTVVVRDPRTLGQRRADAVVDLIRAGAATVPADPRPDAEDDAEDAEDGADRRPPRPPRRPRMVPRAAVVTGR